jgi:hypothetical protein
MPTTIEGRVPAVAPATMAPTLDEPVSIFAALIDGLTSCQRYTVEARDGELFVMPVAPRSELRSLPRAA